MASVMVFFDIPDPLEIQCFIEKIMTFLGILIQPNLSAHRSQTESHSTLIALARVYLLYFVSFMVKISFSSVFGDKNFSPARQGLACSSVQVSRNSRYKGDRMFGKWQNFPILSKTVYIKCI